MPGERVSMRKIRKGLRLWFAQKLSQRAVADSLRIELMRPDNAPDKDQPGTVPLRVVDVQEIDPPAGVEPLHCWLLTTHTVTTLERTRQIVVWYRMRWIIEQVFRSMKWDCLRIEDSQLEHASSSTKLAIVGLIASIRSMQLVMARDGSTGQPFTDAADPTDMLGCGHSTAPWKGAPRNSGTRLMKRSSPGTPGSLPDWADGPVVRRADIVRHDPKPCIMCSSGSTRSSPDGAWRIVARTYDSCKAWHGDDEGRGRGP